MQLGEASDALAALGNPLRLLVFRMLVQAGPAGLPAGHMATRLAMAPSSLSFHLQELAHAGLVEGRQEGRTIVYSARFAFINAVLSYLMEDCCGGNPCSPVTAGGPVRKPQ